MARNEEKAQSMLYRFREAQLAELGISTRKEKRPYLASEVDSINEAEKWRRQVLSEISRKVSKIQDVGLSDYQVRDLNDEINKLMREKMHWERRIKELGGPDYFKIGPKMLDNEGKEVPGNRGYKYFGRAKDLPGVRELFETDAPEASKKTRFELYKNVDADYYGYRDEEDGLLLQYEAERGKALIQQILAANGDDDIPDVDRMQTETDESQASAKKNGIVDESEEDAEADEDTIITPQYVPNQKEIEEYLVQRRRQQLLEKYVTSP